MLYTQYEKEYVQCNQFKIITLGNFRILQDNMDLTNKFNNCLKIWELFKYLLTYRDELIPPEKIISSIWPGADYADPKRTLRALIFRLRRTLNWENDKNNSSIVVYSHGCYKLETKHQCKIDVDEFEESFHSAYKISSEDTSKAIELFGKVIDMYKGEYLSETCGHDWLIPVRNHYRRIFLQSVYQICDLLKEEKRYQETLDACEKALKYEMFEEAVHFRYIEALAGSGKIKQAKNHFEYVSEVFKRELGVNPSRELQEFYRLLVGDFRKTSIDVISIEENFKDEESSLGPVICDAKFFKFLFQVEKRRFERYGQKTFMGLITLTLSENFFLEQSLLREGMKGLKHILKSNLRKGDVITQWNDNQYLISLPGLNSEQAIKALDRIEKIFRNSEEYSKLIIHTRFQPVLPTKDYTKPIEMFL